MATLQRPQQDNGPWAPEGAQEQMAVPRGQQGDGTAMATGASAAPSGLSSSHSAAAFTPSAEAGPEWDAGGTGVAREPRKGGTAVGGGGGGGGTAVDVPPLRLADAHQRRRKQSKLRRRAKRAKAKRQGSTGSAVSSAPAPGSAGWLSRPASSSSSQPAPSQRQQHQLGMVLDSLSRHTNPEHNATARSMSSVLGEHTVAAVTNRTLSTAQVSTRSRGSTLTAKTVRRPLPAPMHNRVRSQPACVVSLSVVTQGEHLGTVLGRGGGGGGGGGGEGGGGGGSA